MPSSSLSPRSAGHAYIIVAALAAIYMLSQFLRNSLAVIAPDLAQEFQLDAAELGLLSSGFFLAFSGAQIPLGAAIDYFGPMKPMIVTSLIVVLSLLLFSFARDPFALTFARFLMGLGCSSFFMAPLALYSLLFSKERFATIASLHLGVGSLGMLAATSPLAFSVANYGWRASFLGVACFAVAALLLLIVLDRRAPQPRAARKHKETWREIASGVFAATRIRGFWPLFFMQAAFSGAFGSIVSLWIGPWLAQVYGLPLEERGKMTLILGVTQIAALFAWGPSDRLLRSYRAPVVIGALASSLVLGIGACTIFPIGALPFYLMAFGAALAFYPPLVAHGKALFPDALVGRGLTLLNMGTMGGVFVMQSATGVVMDCFDVRIVAGARIYPPEAFQTVFAILTVQMLLALIFYAKAPDPRSQF